MSSSGRVAILYPDPDPLSPRNWSGTPSGITAGLRHAGVEVVPVGYRLPGIVRTSIGALSRLGGRRGAVAHRSPVQHRTRTIALNRELRRAGPLDGLIAMATELYDLGAVVPAGLAVATYDDCTLQQMWRNPDAEIRSWDFPDREVQRWFRYQAASTRAARACCVSTRFAATSFIEDYGIPSERVHVVGMGHRPRTVPTDGARDWSAPRFLFVGVEWPRKNGEAVLRAFRAVREQVPSATLDVVGQHPPIDDAGVTGHGFLPRDDAAGQALLNDLFARATAFVLPSRFDPSPIAYLEAASAGLPVIATTEGGAGELLGTAAITVHPDDDESLRAAMLRLCDPEEARLMGAEASRRAQLSSWNDVAERILATLS